MATVKVNRESLIKRLEEVLGESEGIKKDVPTDEEIARAIRDAEYSLARNEQQAQELARHIKAVKADLKSLNSTRPQVRVVRKYVGGPSSRLGSWAKDTLRSEIRILKLSDEEFIRVGTNSNLAQFL